MNKKFTETHSFSFFIKLNIVPKFSQPTVPQQAPLNQIKAPERFSSTRKAGFDSSTFPKAD